MFDMTKFKRSGIVLGAAAVTALGVGGVAVAQNAGQAQKPAQVKKATEPKGPDRDNIQSGDQTTPDVKGSASEAPGTETEDGPGKAEAPGTETEDGPGKAEAPGTETKDGPGKAEAPGTETKDGPGKAEAPGSETKANSDGPGGHADEPGNPNADHQFQGKE